MARVRSRRGQQATTGQATQEYQPIQREPQEVAAEVPTSEELISSLASQGLPADQVQLTDPVTQEARGVTQADVEADQATLERYQGLGTVALDPDQISPEQMQESVNTRLGELAETRKQTKQTAKIADQTVTDAENISVAARDTAQWLYDDTNQLQFQDEQGPYDLKMRELVQTVLPGVQPAQQGMALNAAAAMIFTDPAFTALDKKGKPETDPKKAFTLEEIRKGAASKPSQFEGSIGKAKAELFQGNPRDYAVLNAAAEGIGQRAREMAQVETEDTANDAIIGEQIIQRGLDNGDLVIGSHKATPNSPTTYFLAPTRQGQNKYNGYSGMIDVLLPQNTQQKLGRGVPSQFGDSPFDSPRDLEKAKKNFAEGDIQAVNVLNRTGVETDPYTLAAVIRMRELADADHPVGLAYFKIEQKDLNETRDRAYKRALAEGRPEPEAQERANREAQNVKNTKMSGSLAAIEQVGKDKGVAYPDFNYGTNHRFINRASNTNFEDKAVVRATKNFAKRGAVRRYSPEREQEYKGYATKLHNILYTNNNRARGQQASKDYESLSKMEQSEMSQAAMYAKHYIALLGQKGDTYTSSLTGKSQPVNVKRMNPADLIDYFSQNHKTIMPALGALAVETDQFIASGDPTIIENNHVLEEVFARGELPWFVSTMEDIQADLGGNGNGAFTANTRTEIDANNSNVAIQSIKTGNIAGASTLGFDVDPTDTEAWFNNPDSFYTILGDEIRTRSVSNVIADPDHRAAMSKYFEATTGKSPKEQTRAIVVEGFYGLHPSVNRGALDKLKATQSQPYQQLVKEVGDADKVDEMLLAVRADAFNTILADKSVSKFTKNVSSVIAIQGDYSFSARTATGAQVDFGVGELMPEYQQSVAYDEATGGQYTKLDKAHYQTPDGELIPLASRSRRIDFDQPKVAINSKGQSTDISKAAGLALGDSIAATLTHAEDAGLMKASVLQQGVDKPEGIANMPIHDANVLNNTSYINHWIAYNMVATPSAAVTHNTYDQLYDQAVDVYNSLQDKGKKAQAAGETINVGTGQLSQHRALFGIFDYHQANLGRGSTIPQTEAAKTRHEQGNARIKNILSEAKAAGWVPKGEGNRTNVEVNGKAFSKLVDSAYAIQDVFSHESDKTNQSKMQAKLDRWNHQRGKMTPAIKRGLYRTNAQN